MQKSYEKKRKNLLNKILTWIFFSISFLWQTKTKSWEKIDTDSQQSRKGSQKFLKRSIYGKILCWGNNEPFCLFPPFICCRCNHIYTLPSSRATLNFKSDLYTSNFQDNINLCCKRRAKKKYEENLYIYQMIYAFSSFLFFSYDILILILNLILLFSLFIITYHLNEIYNRIVATAKSNHDRNVWREKHSHKW